MAGFGYFSRNEGASSGRQRGGSPTAGREVAPPWRNENVFAHSLDDLAEPEIEEPTGTLGMLAPVMRRRRAVRIYPFGISRDRLEQSARQLRVPVEISRDQDHADAVITLKNFYRRQPDRLRPAESERKPIYVLKNNTVEQMAEALAHIFELGRPAPAELGGLGKDSPHEAMLEAEDAINHVLTNGTGQVELTPQNSYVRRMQHAMAERYNLISRSRGKEPNRRVRIFSR